jgi:hypothetical protein
MAITITVEDGSNVTNANSYVSVANARAYAVDRGVTLSSTDDEVAAFLIHATDYLEAQGLKYQGEKAAIAAGTTQALAWPRDCVVLDGVTFANNAIPQALINAQCALVLAQNEGLVLQPNIKPQNYVIESTVGPLTTKFADPTKTGVMPEFPAVDALLAPLFKPANVGIGLRAVRV